MATAKFDDGITSNPKIIAAGPVASWLWFSSVLYCRRGLTDGLILRIVVPSLVIGLKSPRTHAAKLVEVGLWDVTTTSASMTSSRGITKEQSKAIAPATASGNRAVRQ
jgi:hypothetical protein